MGWIALTVVLALTVLVLGLSLLSLRRALREVAEELEEKLAADTNTLITLSTGDRAVRALAARINTQLHALRAERLRLRNGDRELKAAVTNVSHELKTPAGAISLLTISARRSPLSSAIWTCWKGRSTRRTDGGISPSSGSGQRPCAP